MNKQHLFSLLAPKPAKAWVSIVIVMALAGLIAGCDEPQKSQSKKQSPQVTIAKPVVREIIEWDDYTRRFGAIDFVEVRARVSGYLDKIHFKDGQIIKKGDFLFTIDQRPFNLALEKARACHSFRLTHKNLTDALKRPGFLFYSV